MWFLFLVWRNQETAQHLGARVSLGIIYHLPYLSSCIIRHPQFLGGSVVKNPFAKV